MTTRFKLSWRKWFWVWLVGSCLLGAILLVVPAQAAAPISLTVQLRHSDGTAVTNEPVSLERLPDEETISPACLTDTSGRCTWPVGRGLYQLLFDRPLDTISELALAEGGLRGFGLTVGEANITYHFTFHSDGRVYFDAAPEAAVPSPIIPVGEVLHGGVAPTEVPLAIVTESVGPTPTPDAASTPETAVGSNSGSGWRLLLFIGGGLALGGSLHVWSRQRQAAARLAEKSTSQPVAHQVEEPDA
ncbi:MAG: hypothetical protein H6656_00915 [Ardenticatenaceae bacterium]|nr:hypothetical protein [Anaerolineales bacterium]MCB9005946.1 hypothetical protein [Ardenticatenaceae bacterium]